MRNKIPPRLELALSTAELVGFKVGRETDNSAEIHEIFHRAGYKPGTSRWREAQRGVDLIRFHILTASVPMVA